MENASSHTVRSSGSRRSWLIVLVASVLVAGSVVGGLIASSSSPREPLFSNYRSLSCTGTSCVGIADKVVGRYHQFHPVLVEADASGVSVIPTPVPVGPTELSCTPSGTCLGVALDADQGVQDTVLLRGQRVTLLARPSSFKVTGLSCPSITSCVVIGTWLVGRSVGDALISWRPGKGWTSPVVLLSPTPRYGVNSISCPRPGQCMVVGAWSRPGNTSPTQPLALRLVGGRWQRVQVPARFHADSFDQVSCATISYCVAIGRVPVGHYHEIASMAAVWDGSVWKELPQLKAGRLSVWASDVDCPAAQDCVVVGWGDVPPRVELRPPIGGSIGPPPWSVALRWDGSAWGTLFAPGTIGVVPAQGGLGAVSCSSATICTVSATSGPYSEMLVRYNDGTWSAT